MVVVDKISFVPLPHPTFWSDLTPVESFLVDRSELIKLFSRYLISANLEFPLIFIARYTFTQLSDYRSKHRPAVNLGSFPLSTGSELHECISCPTLANSIRLGTSGLKIALPMFSWFYGFWFLCFQKKSIPTRLPFRIEVLLSTHRKLLTMALVARNEFRGQFDRTDFCSLFIGILSSFLTRKLKTRHLAVRPPLVFKR